MGSGTKSLNYYAAVRDFDRARKQAALQQLMARLTGKSAELLSYNDVQEKLKVEGEVERGLQEIPLEAIVGSVGRYKDFTRNFLPKRDSDEERWARVRTAVADMKGMEPIEVYKVGDVYFVKDGNHRVSVARQLGSDTISAYVTEVETRVPLTIGDDPDEVICKARYVEFLERTNLDKSRPGADLTMTFSGRYHVLCDQIVIHRREMAKEREGKVSYGKAAASWYDEVYCPVVRVIRELGVLRNFPSLTETDLYVLVAERWSELEEALDWRVDPEMAVVELVEQEKQRWRRPIARAGERFAEAIVPVELEEGPEPGSWRRKRLAFGRQDRLFADYLVAVSGSEDDWHMLDQVLKIAQLEKDHLLGLHVVAHKWEKRLPRARSVKERFLTRCQEAGIPADFAIESGKVADVIIKRAAWVDLVVSTLSHRPDSQPFARLGHGFSRLVQRCPRPLLAVPAGAECSLDRLLLAYDGSPKAEEALFVATYLASRWPISLTVLTVETENTSVAALRRARRYIDRYPVKEVEYVLRQKPIAEAILETAAAFDSTQLIMGGFGFRPVMHLVLGSTVDQILREFHRPILICR